MLESAEQIGLVQGKQNFFANNLGLGGGFLRVLAEIVEHDHEFVATKPGHGIAFANAGGQALGHLLQQQIADVEAYVMSLNGTNVAVVSNPGVAPKTFFWWTLGGFVLVAIVGGAALVTTKD